MSNKKYESIKIPENIDDAIEKGVVKALNLNKSNKNNSAKRISKVVAASLVGILVLGVVNPAIASKIPFVGNIFNEIEKNLSFPGNYAQYSTSINETSYSNGIGVTLSELLCDGESIYITYKVEGEKPLPSSSWNNDNKSVNSTNQLITEDAYSIVDFTNEDIGSSGFAGLEGKFIDEYTFIGVNKYKLSNLKSEVPDEFRFKTKIIAIGNYGDGKNSDAFKFGTWAFNIPVKVNKELTNTIDLNYNIDNSYTINSLSLTPFDIVLKGNMPLAGDILYGSDGKEFGYEVFLYDENGEQILTSESERKDNGDSIFVLNKPLETSKYIKILVKKITFEKEIINKNSHTYKTIDEEIVLDNTIDISK